VQLGFYYFYEGTERTGFILVGLGLDLVRWDKQSLEDRMYGL